MKRTPTRYVLCGLILAVAAALRYAGITYGLPFQFHPDESSYVFQAINFGKGDLNPHNFYHPTLFQYSLSLWFALWFVAGFLGGIWHSLLEFQADYIVNTHHFWFLARAFAALLGTVTVYLTYVVGRRRFDVSTGLIAASILAVSFLHVENSQYATTDVAMTLFVPAVLFMALGLADRPSPFYYAFGGLFSGFAAATKYPGGLLIVAIIAAHLLYTGKPTPPRVRRYGLVVSLVWLATGFLVGCPYAILNAGEFLRDLKFMFAISREPWLIGSENVVGWAYYLLETLGSGEGVIFTAIAVLAVLTSPWRGRKEATLAVFPVLYFLYMGSTSFAFSRFLLPVYPALALLMARFILWVARRIERPKLKALAAGALTLAVVAPCAYQVWRLDHLRGLQDPGVRVKEVIAVLAPGVIQDKRPEKIGELQDPRVRAKDWIEANVAPGSRILTDYAIWSPPLEAMAEGLLETRPASKRASSRAATRRGVDVGDAVGGKLDQLRHFAAEKGMSIDDKRLSRYAEIALAPPRYRVTSLHYPTTGVSDSSEAGAPDPTAFDYVVLADTFRDAILARPQKERFQPFARMFKQVEDRGQRVKSYEWSEEWQRFIKRHQIEMPLKIEVYRMR